MVMSLGHCHPRLVEVVQRQVAELSFTYRFSFRNGPMLELAQELRGVSPLDDTWCFFNSSGSESVESAIQLALRYWQLRGHAGKTDLISRWPSFHGSTLGALSLSGSKWRAFYEPILGKHPVAPVPERRHPPAPRSRRGGGLGRARARGRDPAPRRAERRGRRDRARDRRLRRRDRAAAGRTSPSCGEICDRHELLLVFDETITAFGRTGEWFAADHWPDAKPDIITFAKGVTSGIVPFSGVLVSGPVAELFEQSPAGLPLRPHVLGLPARLCGRGGGDPRDPRRGPGGRVAAQGRAPARPASTRWLPLAARSATCAGSGSCRASSW